MRLWSLHPKYLDRAGLLALWREGLLAQKVLLGKTKGYHSHPQLARFRACSDPVRAIGRYLEAVLGESRNRGYRFDGSKIEKIGRGVRIEVTKGQIEYEWQHLFGKLKVRDRKTYSMNRTVARPQPHPLFRVVPGGIEEWERI